jgi:hypothetical protein
MTLNAEEQPLSVQALNGEVVMTGPRVAIALGPEAATETARRLAAAADMALRQASDALLLEADGAPSKDIA